MKYFIDTEFLEGTQIKTFLGMKIGHTKPTIDLISIGIVSEDGREYYTISKDFNLKEAWNRYDLNYGNGDQRNIPPRKVYWIRENVLKPIWYDLICMEGFPEEGKSNVYSFTYKEFKKLLNKYGKTNKQIAEEVLDFINTNGTFVHKPYDNSQKNIVFSDVIEKYGKPQFYGYYSDYDWVVFCWLFGKMIELPNGFPMYCHDLKQDYDFFNRNFIERKKLNAIRNIHKSINKLKDFENYPKQTNEHNALSDARWNKELYNFLNIL